MLASFPMGADDVASESSKIEYPHKPNIAGNQSHWATSSSLIVWICLQSNFRSGLRKTHMF